MNGVQYISLLSTNNGTAHTALFSSSKGNETAGSVASSSLYGGAYSSIKGETAGSVASSSVGTSSSSSGSGGSFSAIA